MDFFYEFTFIYENKFLSIMGVDLHFGGVRKRSAAKKRDFRDFTWDISWFWLL